MKIPGSENFIKNAISKAESKGSKRVGSKGSKTAGKETASSGAASSEKVLLSSTGKDIARISDIIKASPDIRAEKVERIKTEIDNGTYSIDGKKIAENILKEILSESSFLE